MLMIEMTGYLFNDKDNYLSNELYDHLTIEITLFLDSNDYLLT